MLHRGLWYRYLANELDAARLPALSAIALYGQRRVASLGNLVVLRGAG